MDKLKAVDKYKRAKSKYGDNRPKGRPRLNQSRRLPNIYNPENRNLEWKEFKLGLYLLDKYSKLNEDDLGV